MLGLAIAGLSCGGSGEDDSGASENDDALVDHEEWEEVLSVDDVFGDRPAVVDCPFGWAPEPFGAGDSLGVDLAVCDYLTVTQPSLRDVAAGQTVRIRVYHFPLESPVPGVRAHLAIAFDREVVWERFLDIPADASVIDAEFVAGREFAAGVPIDFHVHNHGPNSYNLVWIERE